MTTIAIGLAVGVAVVIGVGVANWSPLEPARRDSSRTAQVASDACNHQAAAQTSQTGKTIEIVKDERYLTVYASCMRSRGDMR